MELRHLRYFIAVAEAKSLRAAAEERLHTTQPSLSRQIRDLEAEVGAPLFVRNAKGVALTAAGRVLLDHARALLSQADAALAATRRVAAPTRPSLSLGFLIGHETTWMPAALRLLRNELPDVHVVISTQNSPQLGEAVRMGWIDAAFLRRVDGGPDLDYKRLVDEPVAVFLPSDHPLAACSSIDVAALRTEPFIAVSGAALDSPAKSPALRSTVDRYIRDRGLELIPSHEVDNLGAAMSLIASTRGFALLPTYAAIFLIDAVAQRTLRGPAPTIDLSVGYRRTNPSAVLKVFLARVDESIVGASADRLLT